MLQKTIHPLGTRVLIKRADPITKKGTILLPESAKEKPQQGIVIAVGPGGYDKEGNPTSTDVKEGDTVLFGSFAGTPIAEDKDLLILSSDDILAVVE